MAKNVVASKKMTENPHTKLKMTKNVAPPKKDGKKKSHPQERWQKYVAPPKKSRIVKKKMAKKCRKIGQK